MADSKDASDKDKKAEEPDLNHRVSVAADGANEGVIETVALAGYAVDAINESPRLLNLLPGVDGVGPMTPTPAFGHDDLRNKLLAAYNGYLGLFGYQRVQQVDTADKVLHFAGEVAGAAIVPVGEVSLAAKGAARAAEITVGKEAAGVTAAEGKGVIKGAAEWLTTRSARNLYKSDLPLGEKIAQLTARGDTRSLDYVERLLHRATRRGIDDMDKVRRTPGLSKEMMGRLEEINAHFINRGTVARAVDKVVAPIEYAVSNPGEAALGVAKAAVKTPVSIAASQVKKHPLLATAAAGAVAADVKLTGGAATSVVAGTAFNAASEAAKTAGALAVAAVTGTDKPAAAATGAPEGTPDASVHFKDSAEPQNPAVAEEQKGIKDRAIDGMKDWAMGHLESHPFMARLGLFLATYVPLRLANKSFMGDSELLNLVILVAAAGAVFKTFGAPESVKSVMNMASNVISGTPAEEERRAAAPALVPAPAPL